jgi:hypothetical protein
MRKVALMERREAADPHANTSGPGISVSRQPTRKGGGSIESKGGVRNTVFPPWDYDTRTDTADGKEVDGKEGPLDCLVG